MNQSAVQLRLINSRVQELAMLMASYRAGQTPTGQKLEVTPDMMQQTEAAYFEAQRQSLGLQAQIDDVSFSAGKLGAADTQPQSLISAAVAELPNVPGAQHAMDKIGTFLGQTGQIAKDPQTGQIAPTSVADILAWYARVGNKQIARRYGMDRYFIYLGHLLTRRTQMVLPPNQQQGVISDITGKAAADALKNSPLNVEAEAAAGEGEGTDIGEVEKSLQYSP